MNEQELSEFWARMELFARRGLRDLDAERLADKCLFRDRDQAGHWRACMECANAQRLGATVRISRERDREFAEV
ncbi:hypothetical protein [Candidatus Symbiobacter mobilis]|nr:hypothetical protein [Candidatus Symbiobacter mobilis]